MPTCQVEVTGSDGRIERIEVQATSAFDAGFIFYYAKIHGFAPAESDMQKYFKVSPPSVHQMVLTLEANGFIERVPGRARSIRLLIPREELPDLE